MKAQGTVLLKRDIELVEQKIVDVYNTALYVEEPGLSAPYMLFDSEVANPFQQELFNRELIVFLMSISELGLDEESAEQKLMEGQIDKLLEHWRILGHDVSPNQARCTEYLSGRSEAPPERSCYDYVLRGRYIQSYEQVTDEECLAKYKSKQNRYRNAQNTCHAFSQTYQFVDNPEFESCFRTNKEALGRLPNMQRCMQRHPLAWTETAKYESLRFLVD